VRKSPQVGTQKGSKSKVKLRHWQINHKKACSGSMGSGSKFGLVVFMAHQQVLKKEIKSQFLETDSRGIGSPTHNVSYFHTSTLGSIPASSDSVESEGRQMKQR
jgi:hypothetical protein